MHCHFHWTFTAVSWKGWSFNLANTYWVFKEIKCIKASPFDMTSQQLTRVIGNLSLPHTNMFTIQSIVSGVLQNTTCKCPLGALVRCSHKLAHTRTQCNDLARYCHAMWPQCSTSIMFTMWKDYSTRNVSIYYTLHDTMLTVYGTIKDQVIVGLINFKGLTVNVFSKVFYV